MKKRAGFVSNSSSTSFCIFGVHLPESDFLEFLGIEDEFEYDDVEHAIYKIEKDSPLSIYSSYEDYYGYIGCGVGSLRDDETYGEFKIRVEAEIAKVGLKDKELSWHEDTIYC